MALANRGQAPRLLLACWPCPSRAQLEPWALPSASCRKQHVQDNRPGAGPGCLAGPVLPPDTTASRGAHPVSSSAVTLWSAAGTTAAKAMGCGCLLGPCPPVTCKLPKARTEPEPTSDPDIAQTRGAFSSREVSLYNNSLKKMVLTPSPVLSTEKPTTCISMLVHSSKHV